MGKTPRKTLGGQNSPHIHNRGAPLPLSNSLQWIVYLLEVQSYTGLSEGFMSLKECPRARASVAK